MFAQLLNPTTEKCEFLIYYFGRQQRYIVFGDQLFTREGICLSCRLTVVNGT